MSRTAGIGSTTLWHSEREPKKHPPKFAAQILKGRQPSLRDDRDEFRKNIPVNFQDGNRWAAWPKEPSAKTAPNPSFYAARHYYDGGGYYQNVAFPDGSSYEGDFNADSKFHGRGMFVWKNGDRCWTVRPRPATTLLRPMGVACEACQGKKKGAGAVRAHRVLLWRADPSCQPRHGVSESFVR